MGLDLFPGGRISSETQTDVETSRLNAYGSDTDFFVQGLSISRTRDLI